MEEKYEMVIGLEVHVQLNTRSKAFCGDENKFGENANTLTSAISLGHPGTLPRLNQKQLEKAIRLGLALGGKINPFTNFDRKNYFYPDLPKGYQITQDKFPIVIGGEMKLPSRTIRIHHIHMEEDAGKLIHDLEEKYSLVDLNRAGVPLLEIVTEPDFRSAQEVELFIEKLRHLVRWLDVSDGNMEEGTLRCDVNLSLRPRGQEPYGNRCEIKNLNSMRFARQAIAFERNRQTKLLDSGKKVNQQTLNFDSVSGTTSPLRDKEDAHDYRYFPDPDLPPVLISKDEIEAIQESMPEMSWSIVDRWVADYDMLESDGKILVLTKSRAEIADKFLMSSKYPKMLSQFMVNKLLPFANDEQKGMDKLGIDKSGLDSFLGLIREEKVASSLAYQKLFPEWILNPNQNPETLAISMKLIQNNDEDVIKDTLLQIIAENPNEVKDFQNGKKQLIGFFMGKLMKSDGVKVNPKVAKDMILKVLESNGE